MALLPTGESSLGFISSPFFYREGITRKEWLLTIFVETEPVITPTI
jgi:hypothetical protein